MLKRVEEDWSFFNRAVREKAEGQPRLEAPPLKLVTPKRSPTPSKSATPASPFATQAPAPNKPAPPMSPPAPSTQPPATATASSTRSPGFQPLNVGKEIASIAKLLFVLLFGIIAIVMLIALIEAASRNAHSTSSVATGAGPEVVANGKVVTDYTTFNTVTYRSWKVITGWKFADSRAAPPNRQYCYLEVPTTGGQQIYDIEERAPIKRHDMPGALVPGLNKAAWDEAATKCVWHR